MDNFKLAKDFGVSALIAVSVVVLGFTALILGMLTGHIEGTIVAVAASSGISAAISTYLTVKAVKQGQNNKKEE